MKVAMAAASLPVVGSNCHLPKGSEIPSSCKEPPIQLADFLFASTAVFLGL